MKFHVRRTRINISFEFLLRRLGFFKLHIEFLDTLAAESSQQPPAASSVPDVFGEWIISGLLLIESAPVAHDVVRSGCVEKEGRSQMTRASSVGNSHLMLSPGVLIKGFDSTFYRAVLLTICVRAYQIVDRRALRRLVVSTKLEIRREFDAQVYCISRTPTRRGHRYNHML